MVGLGLGGFTLVHLGGPSKGHLLGFVKRKELENFLGQMYEQGGVMFVNLSVSFLLEFN